MALIRRRNFQSLEQHEVQSKLCYSVCKPIKEINVPSAPASGSSDLFLPGPRNMQNFLCPCCRLDPLGQWSYPQTSGLAIPSFSFGHAAKTAFAIDPKEAANFYDTGPTIHSICTTLLSEPIPGGPHTKGQQPFGSHPRSEMFHQTMSPATDSEDRSETGFTIAPAVQVPN